MSHLKNWDWKCGILHISPLLYVRAHDWLKNRKLLNRCVFAPFILILPSSQSTVENIKLLNYHTVTHIVIHEKQHALLWGNTQLILFSPLIHKTSLSSSYTRVLFIRNRVFSQPQISYEFPLFQPQKFLKFAFALDFLFF